MCSYILAENAFVDALITTISHLGGDKKCRHFRTIGHLSPETVPDHIVAFATAFEEFTKAFIHARYAHCPEDLLTNADNPQNNIAKLLNMTIVTKGQALETLAHFANIITTPGFISEYMEINKNLQSEADIALNYAFITEFRDKFYNYGETWIWNYFRKCIYLTSMLFIYTIMYVVIMLIYIFELFIVAFFEGGVLFITLINIINNTVNSISAKLASAFRTMRH